MSMRSIKEIGLVWIAMPIVVFGGAWALAGLPDWLSALCIGSAVASALWVATWYERRRPAPAPAESAVEEIGSAARELEVVVVVGPYAAALFPREGGRATLRRDDRAVWLLADTPARLNDVMTQVKAARGRFPDAALLPVVPEGDDESVLRREFAQWRIALQAAYCHPECVLPCHVAVYACLGPGKDGTPQTRWFGDSLEFNAPRLKNAIGVSDRLPAIRSQLAESRHAEAAGRSALGLAVFEWLDEAALLSSISALSNTVPFALRGASLADIDHTPVRPGAWTRWLIAKTGLQPRVTKPVAGPLPLPRIRALASVSADTDGRPPAPSSVNRRAWPLASHVLLSSVTAVTVAVAISGAVNYRLVERIADDLSIYWNTPSVRITASIDSFERLRTARDEVARNLHDGAPFGAGWGLYPGRALLPRVDVALAAYRPPLTTVQIDSLSLFPSGKATFSPAHEHRELAHVLRLIRENPDQRVLIEGHADSEGSSDANLRLSEARARAIRDWLVVEGGLPVTRFAIQGMGDIRPIADNRSEAGRALNRRVDVSLIPDGLRR
ncbi:OmpA family protein [Burkholderia ambifaria]|uniref:OmpA family protein n=2 Tax=Burkholderia ambifaria TaxID=152480 RepID=A0AA41JM21_9BURK|nr:OmpA family protein [Burkholderia ambifaria]PRE04663.1 OmpA family protein [Burkholderia ambifaria]